MSNIYQDGTYLDNNATWHIEDSPWKAKQILKIIDDLELTSICEVGCGAGEILAQLYQQMPQIIQFHGYEISQQAFELCLQRKNKRIHFHLKDFFEDESTFFDLVLAIDVFEHIEDYMGFLRKLKDKGKYKIFHIPLDISVQAVLRSSPILKARESVGHIHYFTKETALATLRDSGYEIMAYFYTHGALELPNQDLKTSLFNLPRKLMFLLNKDWAVRILGGFSLMVLAK